MKTLNKFIVSIALLCLSQTAFAACNDADAYDDCIDVVGDENDSIGSGTGGGGSLGFGGSGGGGSDGGSDGGNGGGGGSGQGGGESSGEEESEEEEHVDPPKTPRQKCQESAEVGYAFCKELAADLYIEELKSNCSHLLNWNGSFEGFLVSLGFSSDEFARCEKIEAGVRDHSYAKCTTDKAVSLTNCP